MELRADNRLELIAFAQSFATANRDVKTCERDLRHDLLGISDASLMLSSRCSVASKASIAWQSVGMAAPNTFSSINACPAEPLTIFKLTEQVDPADCKWNYDSANPKAA